MNDNAQTTNTNPKEEHKMDEKTKAKPTKAKPEPKEARGKAKGRAKKAPTREERRRRRSASATLKRYRVNYVRTDGYAGLSINCGDDTADLLKMFEPTRVVKIAESVLPNIKAGQLAKQYAHLNPGMQRMNAGNRIRSALKKGAITKTALKKAMKSA